MTETQTTSTNRGTEFIESIVEQLALEKSTKQLALAIFKQTKGNRNGRSLEIIATACVYLACKQESRPTSPEDIINCTNSTHTRKQLLQMSKSIDTELSLGINRFNPQTYVTNYSKELSLSDEATELATRIVQIGTEEGVASGRSPTGFAAAAIYYASILSNEKRTQREVSDVSNVSEVTIRNTYQDQADCVGDSLNQVI